MTATDKGPYPAWNVDEFGRLRPATPDVSGMLAPRMCKFCGLVHDSGPVEVIARYADCSVWRCPGCKAQIDDRPGGWGGSYAVDKRTGEVRT